MTKAKQADCRKACPECPLAGRGDPQERRAVGILIGYYEGLPPDFDRSTVDTEDVERVAHAMGVSPAAVPLIQGATERILQDQCPTSIRELK